MKRRSCAWLTPGAHTCPTYCTPTHLYSLLYVNNLVPLTEYAGEAWDAAGGGIGCMGWSWYLANDFQFFLFLPLYCLAFHRGAWHGAAAVGGTILVQIIATAVSLYSADILGSTNIGDASQQTLTTREAQWIYTKPWCRVVPYVLGIAVAHVYRHARHAKASAAAAAMPLVSGRTKSRSLSMAAPLAPFLRRRKTFLAALVAFAAVLFATVVFGYYAQIKCPASRPGCGYGLLAPGNWARYPIGGYLYYILSPIAWSLALSAFCFAMFMGWGGMLKRGLEWRIWTPLGRLTYGAYLIHNMVIMW